MLVVWRLDWRLISFVALPRAVFTTRSHRTRPCGGDEVVKDLHHRGWGLDVREVPDAGEHLKPATRHGVVSGVAVGDRDDPILITPDQQDR